MRQDEQVRVIRTLMDHLDAGTNVDAGGIRRINAAEYTSPERAAVEWDRFFRNHPQIIGLSGDLPEPNSFMTINDFGSPILATRDKQGRFRAFANICRHRGTILEEAPRGTKSRFSCPFHAWTYDNGGKLIGLPKSEHFGAVDKGCFNLLELPAAESGGLLIVHPQPDGVIDLDVVLGGLDDEFKAWDFGRMQALGNDLYETPMNWKLAIDTFGETYHFEKLHEKTLTPYFYGNVQAYDIFGRNHRMSLCVKSIDMLRQMPQDQWQVTMGAFPVYYMFPNVQLNVGHGFAILLRVYPVPGQPGQSFSRISLYAYPEVYEADPENVMFRMRAFATIIRDEDYVAAASCYRGAASGLIGEFVFGRNEPALHHYHNTYHAALGLDPLPLEPA